MENKDLVKSNVKFEAESHTYWLDGKILSGITGVITRHVFPDKYSGVSQDVLNRRADFGTAFHNEMELYINAGIEGTSDAFKVFKENWGGIRFIASEYLVTDGAYFASAIDAVDCDEIIYDFKTTSKKDIPYWQWQLGVYRVFYHMQNGRWPKGCRVVWINKDMKHELLDIEPVSEERVQALLTAERAGIPFIDPAEVEAASIIPDERVAALAVIEREIVRRETELKKKQDERDQMKAAILEAMTVSGVNSFETDAMKLTVKASYTKKSVDGAKLKEKHPKIYEKFLKETTVKASLVITLKE